VNEFNEGSHVLTPGSAELRGKPGDSRSSTLTGLPRLKILKTVRIHSQFIHLCD